MRIILALFVLAMAHPVGGQEKLFLHPEREKLTSDVFVLFDHTFEAKSTVLSAYKNGNRADIPIPELRDTEIKDGYGILPELPIASANGESSARQKLGRYILLRTESPAAAERISRRLAARPDVLYASVSITGQPNAGCPSLNPNPPLIQVTESKTWGFSMVRASSAWNYARGHSYIGIADFGSDPNHDDLKPFNGNTYLKGNFQEHLSIDAANRVSPSSQGANPYTGQAFFGSIDEYLPLYHSSDFDCDTNNNGFVEMQFAGHGTAVTGVIGASAENSIGMKGVCRHCPIAMARFGQNEGCADTADYQYPGNDPITGAYFEAHPFTGADVPSMVAAIGFMLDVGAQVVNVSGGAGYSGSHCSAFPTEPFCLVLEYAADVDVPIVAAGGNFNRTVLDFPAADSRAWGIAGVENGGARWDEGPLCGSNSGSGSHRPHFAAPAVDVYSTMYPDVSYHGEVCHEYNDGMPGDGFGYCTGTSLSAPYITAIAGLLRSVNPLMSTNTLYNVLKANSSQTTRTNGLGWGVPKTDLAVRDALGIVNMSQNLNRATPLFELYSSVAKDFVHTTKPQTAVAFARNITWDYQSVSTTPSVRGFSYSESSSSINPVQVARAAAFVLTTHRLPSGFPSAIPIYRMRYKGSQGANPNNADAAIVVQSEVSGFKSVGYNMDGMEGYIFSLCSPEPGCIPNGAEQFYRAYNANRDDHAVFLESSKSSYQAAGYTLDLTKLGYAFRNQHSDADDLIDGFEAMLGLNKFSTDSDCDGTADDSEFPLRLSPSSDPLQPNLCGGL